jgi:uncharacterized protein YjlB
MRLETWKAPPGDVIPNHPRFPVLIYQGVEPADARERIATLPAPPQDPVGGEGVARRR